MANFYRRLGIPNMGKRPILADDDEIGFRRLTLTSRNDDNDEAIPTIIDNGNDTIQITHPIGKSGNKIVYRGVYLIEFDPDVGDGHMRIQDVSSSVVGACEKYMEDFGFRDAAVKNRKVPDHPNLLRIREPFICKGYYYTVFPLMDLGSFRTIMANRYPNGLPEACILLALSKTLRGLSLIHACGEVHQQINAGHIFLSARPEIRLGYAASVHDLCADQDHDERDDSGFQKAVDICTWAAAPEVYDSHAHTKEADMWAVGITALELANGGLRVHNREELMAVVKRVNQKKRFPPRKDKLKFSKEFREMVARCLEVIPANRPTAEQLMLSKIFDAADYDLFYSYNLFDHVMSSGVYVT